MNPFWSKDSTVKPQSLSRVLIIHPFGLGDALFITPVIRALKENGVKQIDLLLGSRTRELFETNPHVNQIFEWDKSPLEEAREQWDRFKKLAALFHTIWNNRYQAVFDFSPRAQYAFLALAVFWIPIRIGFNFKSRGFFLTHKLELSEGYRGKPVVEYYLNLLDFFGIQPANKRPELFLSERDQGDGQALIKKLGIDAPRRTFIAVVPGGGESWGKDARLKRWPIEHFVGLIRSLHDRYDDLCETVLILGGSNEYSLGTQLLQKLKGMRVHNLCGAASIRVIASVIQNASILIGNDGGLVHIAHAVGTPVVAIYGPADPIVYGPYPSDSKALIITKEGPACRPCYQRFRYQSACSGVECLTELKPEQVLERLQARHFFDQLNFSMASQGKKQ